MLDGSLIAFIALQIGASCPSVFYSLAEEVRPDRVAMEAEQVKELATAACRQVNPDDLWVASFVRTGFASRVVVLPNKKSYIGPEAMIVAKDLVQGASPGDPYPIAYVGPFFVSFRRYASKFDGKIETAMSAERQVRWLSDTFRPEFRRKCGIKWAQCYFLKGATPRDKAVWKGAEVLLARSARSLLMTRSRKGR